MISYLEGKVIIKKEKFIVLSIGAIGFKIFLSRKALSKITEIGQNLKLFCFLNVRENILNLYGFLDYEELEFFEILNDISGIGPKVSLEISSLGPLEKIKEKILSQDEKVFEGIPGIGKKRAMTIILELSGRIKQISKAPKAEGVEDEAREALISLGFSSQKAKAALEKIPKDIKNTEDRIKEAIKILGRT